MSSDIWMATHAMRNSWYIVHTTNGPKWSAHTAIQYHWLLDGLPYRNLQRFAAQERANVQLLSSGYLVWFKKLTVYTVATVYSHLPIALGSNSVNC